MRSARDLGMDADLLMRSHVVQRRGVSPSPLQLRKIRHSVPFQTVVVSLVLTRVDYGNSVLAGLPVYLVRRQC